MADQDLVETQRGAQPPARDATQATPERYRLIEKLGEGGMGVVWAAHDTFLDRPVALKLLRDRYLGAEDQARLADEARAMARLSHPNVVAVYDVGEHAGRTFLTMELVRGIDLSRWLAEPRTWRQILDVFRAAGRGLAAAHAAGIVHRDIKPSNILVAETGEVRVADFGVAHASVARPDPGALVTAMTAAAIGTPAYMSPEQLRGERSDARADVFAFCASLYEALHGRRPFEGASSEDIYAAIQRGCPPPVKPVPRWLHAAIARGVAPDPVRRFPSMQALLSAIAPRRTRRVLAVGAVVLAAGGLAAGFAWHARGAGCDARGALAGVWDAQIAARTKPAFTGTPYAGDAWTWISGELDRYQAAWIRASDNACRDDDSAVSRCLAERRQQLADAIARVAKPTGAMLADPPSALGDLLPVATCTGEHRSDDARALLVEAVRARDAGDHATAAATSAQALKLADAAHVEDVRMLPLLELYTREALATGALAEAQQGAKRATDATHALGQRSPMYGHAEALSAAYNLQFGRLDKARAKATSALRVAREAFGEEHLDVADAHALLAAVAHAQGAPGIESEELRAALAIRRKLAPDTAPELQRRIDQLHLP